ncbi:hypothetical protein [Paenibacillus sp. ISL-20]|uniref:hypothetical protein n=1 Tax=Paenibacillus sp. ISL-20 TaxID=2819163 RepID=UPI001BEABB5A|nr:hypothetical protein [Paenibacillus sp. ISL-20]MBT2760077.1 hypothetical protein [Paenibacillus sp. ISL-20]
MKRKIIVILLLVFVILINGNAQRDSIDMPLYEGRSLVIGVIGETPQVREEGHVDFKEVTFEQLEDLDLSPELDAVFITKEHLVEASEPKYTEVYNKVEVPFFYIESKKSHVPFTIEELSYDEVPDLSTDMYATGYYGKDDQYWGYGLYNDVMNETNIKAVYSRIFTTIESLHNDGGT